MPDIFIVHPRFNIYPLLSRPHVPRIGHHSSDVSLCFQFTASSIVLVGRAGYVQQDGSIGDAGIWLRLVLHRSGRDVNVLGDVALPLLVRSAYGYCVDHRGTSL